MTLCERFFAFNELFIVMYGLIQTLYDKEKQEQFISLYGDCAPADQMILRATLAESLKDCPRILPSHGTDWILCTLASFQKSPEDTARIFHGVVRKLDRLSFGILNEKIQWKEMNDIADDCLVGLGLFRERMEHMHKFRAAPSPEYYEKAGELAFRRLGFESISENFVGWINFLEKELSETSID
jgi:hypothetical protein